MSKLKLENYYVVPAWARLVLNLSKTELQVFSIIHGFSQTEGSMYTGSIDYLAEWLDVSKSTIFSSIDQLKKKKFILKYKVCNNGNEYNAYVYNRELVTKMIEKYIMDMESKNNKTTIILQKIDNEIEPDNVIKYVEENILNNIEVNIETVQKLDESVQKLDCSVQKSDCSVQKLDESVQKLDCSVQKSYPIYNNINNIKNNNIRYTSLADSAFALNNLSEKNFTNNFENENENCLSEKKNKKATKKSDFFSLSQTDDLGAASRVGVEDLIGERLINLDNKLAAENRRKKQLAAENEPTLEEKTNMRIKKARMKEAQERTSNAELLEALGNFVESYQFSHNKLSKPAWKLILDELFSYGSDESELIKHVNHSIASGYRKIYQYTKYNSNKDFDNTRGRVVEKALHEFTEEEKAEFDKTLARDENGNLIVF